MLGPYHSDMVSFLAIYSLATILPMTSELAVFILCLFLAVPWVCLRTEIVVFSGDTCFLYYCYFLNPKLTL